MFRALLRERLREKPYPLFCFAEGVIPAASVWTGSRLWVEAFRTAGLVPGDRILLALPPSAAWLQVFVAALWEGLTIALVPPARSGAVIDELMRTVDARTAVVETDGLDYFHADWCAGPVSVPVALRKALHPRVPQARFLLRTSGTESGDGRWIALSDSNVLSVANSHLPHLGLREETSRVLSTLPWSHAFGLGIDLLPAILSGAEVHRDASGGRDIAALLETFGGAGITNFCAVPLTVKRLMATGQGREFLRSLKGGVIGGAPIDEALTEFLRTTRLRVGYGQTEASPGIGLGEPGIFPGARYLGRALGCDLRESGEGSLQFRGANACVGTWAPATGITLLEPGRWQDTGDLVRKTAEGDLFFTGRSDSAFKLANGRRIEPEPLENILRNAFPSAEHLLLFSEGGETLTLASDVPFSCDAVLAHLGSLGKLLDAIYIVPRDVFLYTPKGSPRRGATRDAIQSYMLQSRHGNDSL
ncbi:MAG: acyl--CoA ligase [Akkermansiaceae bacterium]|nr:acyl--CoA ligase [Armatimonadota bacterium]